MATRSHNAKLIVGEPATLPSSSINDEPEPLSHDGFVKIKQEPKEDEDLFMSDAPVLPDEPMPDAEKASDSTRRRDAEGEEFATICFQRKHRAHPYKHRLICGHYIVTDNIEECGANCAPAQHAESKPKTRAFQCPHPTCESKSQVAPRRKGRIIVKGRACELSHIYGIDQKEDAERVAEKERQSNKDIRAVALKDRALHRKNSVSPPRRSFTGVATRSRRARHRMPIARNTIEQIVDLEEAERQLKQAFRGRATEQKTRRGHRHQNEAITASTVAPSVVRSKRDINNSDDLSGAPSVPKKGDGKTPNATPRANRSQKGKRKSGDRSGKFCDGDDGHVCDGCNKDIYRIRWTDLDCDDFDLCEICFQHPPDSESEDHKAKCRFGKIRISSNDFEVMNPRALTDVDHDQQTVHCICETVNREYMLECDDCHLSFHPGCVGEGIHQQFQYELPFPDCEPFFRADWENLEKNPVDIFNCLECKRRKEKDAKERFEQGLQDQRKAKADVLRQGVRSEDEQKKRKRAAENEVIEELFGEVESTAGHQCDTGNSGGADDSMEIDGQRVKQDNKRIKVDNDAPRVITGGGKMVTLVMR